MIKVLGTKELQSHCFAVDIEGFLRMWPDAKDTVKPSLQGFFYGMTLKFLMYDLAKVYTSAGTVPSESNWCMTIVIMTESWQMRSGR